MKTMQRVILSIFMGNYRKSSQTDASVCSYWDFLQCTLLEATDRSCLKLQTGGLQDTKKHGGGMIL